MNIIWMFSVSLSYHKMKTCSRYDAISFVFFCVFCWINSLSPESNVTRNCIHYCSYRGRIYIRMSTQTRQIWGIDSCDRPSNLELDSNRRYSARVTLKFDEWPRKTIERFFYTKSSFVHHFKSISEFKLELQSGNAQLGWKLMIFCPMWR